ncbi:MAG: hypothetical protein U0869_02295 [Chloroflexota bacterium]
MNRRPSLPGRHRRLPTATLLATLAGAVVAGPAAAIVPATPSVSAWVVARQTGTLNVAYTPGPKDQGSSAGGTNTITRVSPGQYLVRLGGLNNSLGNAQVTAMQSQPRWCSANEWYGDGSDVVVDVTCRDANGAVANAKFALTYVAGLGTNGGTNKRLAYVYAGSPSGAITPDSVYQYDSNGGSIAIAWTATGRYTVTIPNMGIAGGNVQVGAYNQAATCAAIDWKVVGSDKVIHVACRAPKTGADVDAIIDVLFTANAGPSGFSTVPAAFLLANKPKAASYQPAAAYRYNSAGKSITVMRGSLGNYTVVLTGMPAGGAAIVTPTGTGKAHCQLSSLGTVVPMKAIVRCFTPAGAAVDSPFSLSYTH